jgi:hypothetical protein
MVVLTDKVHTQPRLLNIPHNNACKRDLCVVALWSQTKPTEAWLRDAYHGMAFSEGRLVLYRLIGYMAERERHRSR